jgi:hypothetical protein
MYNKPVEMSLNKIVNARDIGRLAAILVGLQHCKEQNHVTRRRTIFFAFLIALIRKVQATRREPALQVQASLKRCQGAYKGAGILQCDALAGEIQLDLAAGGQSERLLRAVSLFRGDNLAMFSAELQGNRKLSVKHPAIAGEERQKGMNSPPRTTGTCRC